MSTSHTHHKDDPASAVAVHVKSYMIVFAGLLILTGVTVGLSYMDFGSLEANIVIALIVATIKASMVALIFMHLNHEKMQIYGLLAFTVFFVLGLFFLTYFHWVDPIKLPS